MSKTITLKCHVLLSEKFGGIEHGEKPDTYRKGRTLELKSEALAEVLVKKGFAEPARTEKK